MIEQSILDINHEECLEILDEFIRICEKYDINFFLAEGSAIGTVRHKGFIPWDINIDTYMLYPDYIKFASVVKGELPGHMIWGGGESINNLNGGIYLKQSKITEKSRNGSRVVSNVDVSVLINAPNNKIKRICETKKIYYLFKAYRLKNTNVRRSFPYNILKCIASSITNVHYDNILNKLIIKYNKSKCNYLMNCAPWKKKGFEYPKTWFIDGEKIGEDFYFENRKIKLPIEFDFYLRNIYGDYMTPIIEEDKGCYKHAK